MERKKSFFSPIKAWKYLGKKPVTVPMKDIMENPREASDRYRGFHTNDWDKCIGCATCSKICPTDAIIMVEQEDLPDEDGSKPQRPAVDYGRCSFCGLCVDICTTNSLNMSKEYIHISDDTDTFLFLPKENGIHNLEFKNGYIRDEESELLDLERTEMQGIEAKGRKDSFIEIVKGFSKEQAEAEAARCVECGICTKTCPANMNIPEYIRAIWENDMEEALQYVYETNPLPNVCGRVCTHKCETACALKNRGEAVSIRWLKRYVVDNAPDEVYEKVVLSDVTEAVNGKVAVVGSGPSGLSAAYYLRTLGYEVDVYEAKPLAGGVMRYGIPKYRLPDAKLERDISFIEGIGVKIHTNTKVGKDITLAALEEQYDVVYAATGFFGARGLRIPNSDHENVVLGMNFLPEARDFARDNAEMPDIHEHAVVIGGGNVAFDVARSLVRIQNMKYGHSDVKMMALETLEKLPADLEEIEEGKEEGIKFNFGFGPQEIVVNEQTKAIEGVRAWKCLSLFDDEKRFNPQYDKSVEKLVKGTQVFIAIGQMPDYDYIPEVLQEKMEINRGKIGINDHRQVTNIPWLFAGGDIVHGPDIIHGIADGHEAAKEIDAYLMKQRKTELATD